MIFRLILLIVIVAATSCSRTYYVVRQAEKAAAAGSMTANDPPLTEKGNQRALALKEELRLKKIEYIFSTNTIRTRTTAEPLAQLNGITTEIYGPAPDSTFIAKLKLLKRNTLIVGHSNTVDDIVNGLCGSKKLGDLADSEYNNLFVVRIKGKKVRYERRKYGE